MSSKLKLILLLLLAFLGIKYYSGVDSTYYPGLGKHNIVEVRDSVTKGSIIYHLIRINQDGNILLWHSANFGISYQ